MKNPLELTLTINLLKDKLEQVKRYDQKKAGNNNPIRGHGETGHEF
ncbi:hypothetical protein [Salipaludibacillus sp. CF4.18]